MTHPTINPYAPVAHTSPASQPSEPLSFSGTIERSDYQEMLPRDQEWWLLLTLAILLGICILIFGPVTVFLAISKGQLAVAVGVFGFWTLMVAAVWFLKLRIRAADRVNRMLKTCPDVLGCASGEFSEAGLVFRDGIHTYWFGPQHTQHAAILKNGIRMSVGGSSDRYLALNARLFDCYHIDLANGLKQYWKTLAERPVAAGIPDYVEQLVRLGPVPDNAVHFKGQVTTETNLRTTAMRNKAVIEFVSCLSLPFALWFIQPYIEMWMLWVGILFTIYGLYTNVLLWSAYYRGTAQQVGYQFGWISQKEFATSDNYSAVRMPLSDVVSKMNGPELVVLTLKTGQSYDLPRHLVDSDEQWEQLRAIRAGDPD